MESALSHVEAAIAEVTKAQGLLTRSSSAQVRNSDEISRLKAVAFAWFQTHRPIVVQGIAGEDLSTVDGAYHGVLGATARFSARNTYAQALKAAKAGLVSLRKAATVAAPNDASAPEPPPAFAALTSDPAMQAILDRRWDEVQSCLHAGANLAATVMMGGLLETLLLTRLLSTKNKGAMFTAQAAPRDKKTGQTLPLSVWKLVAMVDVAHELGWITKSAKDIGNVLRDFRNYIHPHKEHAEAPRISSEDAEMFWAVCKAIARQILLSV